MTWPCRKPRPLNAPEPGRTGFVSTGGIEQHRSRHAIDRRRAVSSASQPTVDRWSSTAPEQYFDSHEDGDRASDVVHRSSLQASNHGMFLLPTLSPVRIRLT